MRESILIHPGTLMCVSQLCGCVWCTQFELTWVKQQLLVIQDFNSIFSMHRTGGVCRYVHIFWFRRPEATHSYGDILTDSNRLGCRIRPTSIEIFRSLRQPQTFRGGFAKATINKSDCSCLQSTPVTYITQSQLFRTI